MVARYDVLTPDIATIVHGGAAQCSECRAPLAAEPWYIRLRVADITQRLCIDCAAAHSIIRPASAASGAAQADTDDARHNARADAYSAMLARRKAKAITADATAAATPRGNGRAKAQTADRAKAAATQEGMNVASVAKAQATTRPASLTADGITRCMVIGYAADGSQTFTWACGNRVLARTPGPSVLAGEYPGTTRVVRYGSAPDGTVDTNDVIDDWRGNARGAKPAGRPATAPPVKPQAPPATVRPTPPATTPDRTADVSRASAAAVLSAAAAPPAAAGMVTVRTGGLGWLSAILAGIAAGFLRLSARYAPRYATRPAKVARVKAPRPAKVGDKAAAKAIATFAAARAAGMAESDARILAGLPATTAEPATAGSAPATARNRAATAQVELDAALQAAADAFENGAECVMAGETPTPEIDAAYAQAEARLAAAQAKSDRATAAARATTAPRAKADKWADASDRCKVCGCGISPERAAGTATCKACLRNGTAAQAAARKAPPATTPMAPPATTLPCAHCGENARVADAVFCQPCIDAAKAEAQADVDASATRKATNVAAKAEATAQAQAEDSHAAAVLDTMRAWLSGGATDSEVLKAAVSYDTRNRPNVIGLSANELAEMLAAAKAEAAATAPPVKATPATTRKAPPSRVHTDDEWAAAVAVPCATCGKYSVDGAVCRECLAAEADRAKAARGADRAAGDNGAKAQAAAQATPRGRKATATMPPSAARPNQADGPQRDTGPRTIHVAEMDATLAAGESLERGESPATARKVAAAAWHTIMGVTPSGATLNTILAEARAMVATVAEPAAAQAELFAAATAPPAAPTQNGHAAARKAPAAPSTPHGSGAHHTAAQAQQSPTERATATPPPESPAEPATRKVAAAMPAKCDACNRYVRVDGSQWCATCLKAAGRTAPPADTFDTAKAAAAAAHAAATERGATAAQAQAAGDRAAKAAARHAAPPATTDTAPLAATMAARGRVAAAKADRARPATVANNGRNRQRAMAARYGKGARAS